VTPLFVDIHTHKPQGDWIGIRTEGVHPWQAGACAPETLQRPAPGVEAVGEIGLDFACATPREAQLSCFRRQLELAREAGLPVVLHCVRAFEEVMRCLAACPPRTAIFHGFVGSPEQAARALAAGCYLSFGERTFRSPRTLEALRATPLERLFTETDTSAEPIERITARIAEARGVAVERLRQATAENYQRIFGDGQLA